MSAYRFLCVAASLLGFCGVFSSSARAAGPAKSTAFFYGARVPRELTQHFDRVVVDVDNLASWPAPCQAEIYAYLSLGEIGAGRPWRRRVPSGLVAGHNAEWGSEIIDPRKPAWREFILNEVLPPLLKKGIRGLFLDTLDSFEALGPSDAERKEHLRALSALIDAIRARHPELGILLNRGFGIVPLLETPPDGFVVESLFYSADARGRRFRAVSKEETDALLRELHRLQDLLGIPVTVIDYVPARDRPLRREIARRILGEGFEPYVSVPSLDQIGVGRVEPVRRRVLLLYRSEQGNESMPPSDASLAAPPLEWLGYAVEYLDTRHGLPEDPIVDRYAGIVVLASGELGDAYGRWMERRLREGVRVAFLMGLGFVPPEGLLGLMGLEQAPALATPPLRLASASPAMGFEAKVRPLLHELPPYVSTTKGAQSLLRLKDKQGNAWDAAVVGDWGGAAFAPYVVSLDLEEGSRWIINPFSFFRQALALEPIPAPDVTTETGRRILTVHIDGDGFPSHAEFGEHHPAGQVILDEVLRRSSLPHTVSVIEGEVSANGLYPSQSAELEGIARAIFRLPHVEVASHTFSHPFTWADAEAHRQTTPPPALPLPGYEFNAEREIAGSLTYLDDHLLEGGKRARVVLWSGDCSPSGDVVALTTKLGASNVNGGGATLTKGRPSLTRASPLGMNKAEAYQVYAPVQNENVFTHEWRGPFYGYEQVIETFELTDLPRRLGPISIYYHFFSATKTASLVALRKVYAWAEGQETTPLFLSEYAAKVEAFQTLTLSRSLENGAWNIRDQGTLRTLRLGIELGWPDLESSVEVAGVRETAQGRYVHLSSAGPTSLVLASAAPRGPYLMEGNAPVISWQKRRASVAFHLAGHEPLRFSVASNRACTLTTPHGRRRAAALNGVVHWALDEADSGEAELACP